MRVAQILTGQEDSEKELLPSAQRLAPVIAPDHLLTFPELTEASMMLGGYISHVGTRLQEVYPDIRLPELPEQCGNFYAPSWSGITILRDNHGELSWQRHASAARVLLQR